MQPTSHAFVKNARSALGDTQLHRALSNMKAGFQVKRAKAIAGLPEFDQLREQAREVKNHTLANLDIYLHRFETRVIASGGEVHWARTGEEACKLIHEICHGRGARTVTKGKSMVAEEIGLNAYLEARDIKPVETDLGEYIIQLRQELPSHIIAPAIHLNKEQVADAFYKAHTDYPADRPLSEPRELLDEARAVLRRSFLSADVGITGANFLIAETGTTVIVTNEGNGDLTQALPKVHIVVASIDKVIPTLEDATLVLRLLARSATGQEHSTYTTFSTGARRHDDLDGPEAFHVVIVDNGRSALLGTEAQDTLRCIRCGACINHCPIDASVGGHAYGWVVPGPIGAALDPGLIGLAEAHHLPHASTFCGRCESVCPMKIPLPSIMRHWRNQAFEEKVGPRTVRYGVRFWAWLAQRPRLYRTGTRLASFCLRKLAGRKSRIRLLPFARGWTRWRDLPAPQGRSFHDQWQARQRTKVPT